MLHTEGARIQPTGDETNLVQGAIRVFDEHINAVVTIKKTISYCSYNLHQPLAAHRRSQSSCPTTTAKQQHERANCSVQHHRSSSLNIDTEAETEVSAAGAAREMVAIEAVDVGSAREVDFQASVAIRPANYTCYHRNQQATPNGGTTLKPLATRQQEIHYKVSILILLLKGKCPPTATLDEGGSRRKSTSAMGEELSITLATSVELFIPMTKVERLSTKDELLLAKADLSKKEEDLLKTRAELLRKTAENTPSILTERGASTEVQAHCGAVCSKWLGKTNRPQTRKGKSC
ncbi:hypothetical protein KC19_VG284200 [Ceratodon purpureus]|uniref:Uncharacterized protein n=1 Tax=Ceratodon purpureus TaxID=3225 RepID=A0A8T0HV88_CERPU|nr:hypothetical protein KC19_VG284200 [Ceratodon purpureus]